MDLKGRNFLKLLDYTPEEMEYIVNNVNEVVAYLRSMSPVWEDLEKGNKPHLI